MDDIDPLDSMGRSLFGVQPVAHDFKSPLGLPQPGRLLLMTLQRGRGEALELVFGRHSEVIKRIDGTQVDALDATAIDERIREGLSPASMMQIRHGPYAGRSRTTLSLRCQGSVYLAVALSSTLSRRAQFLPEPFGASADAIIPKLPILPHQTPHSYFWWSHTLANGRIAVMAMHNPIGNEAVIPYNINLAIRGGSGSGDSNSSDDHYHGVECVTPMVIDPDMRWPDGVDPPNLPPPPA